jgi:hypothetical protein
MEYLKIQNDGELDIRLISLMGGSTKQGSSTKIGKFGTGLKYSLAWLVRNNIDFRIFVGEKETEIDVKKEVIQNTDFNILYINNERSSITSTMGLDWEGWMICREIYCNALDEGGLVKEITHEVSGLPGKTTFYIQNTGQIKETTQNWNDYFIPRESTPIFENDRYAVYPANKTLCIYKNGVLIHKEENEKGVYSYDFKHASINEMREYKGSLTCDLVYCISSFDKKAAEIYLSTLTDECFEHGMDYDWSNSFSEGWMEAIGKAKIIADSDLKSLKERGVDIDEAELVTVPKGLFKKLADKFPNVSAVRRSEKVHSFYEQQDSEAIKKINIALSILEGAGYEINPELKWVVGVFGNPDVFAKINIDEKLIMFSTELKRKSNFQVVTTIIEEQEHFVSGYGDCTRSFQQHFINLFANILLEKSNISLVK